MEVREGPEHHPTGRERKNEAPGPETGIPCETACLPEKDKEKEKDKGKRKVAACLVTCDTNSDHGSAIKMNSGFKENLRGKLDSLKRKATAPVLQAGYSMYTIH